MLQLQYGIYYPCSEPLFPILLDVAESGMVAQLALTPHFYNI